MEIKIKRIENGKLPEYKTEGAAGADCYARLKKPVIVKAGKPETIPLGFVVEIPEGYEMQIRPRSGLARKNGVKTVLGTIDSDYRGEVGAIMFNDTEEDFEIKNGDRIAQAVICPVIKAEWHLTDKLSETERGENGFGSTGVSEEIKMSFHPHVVGKFYEPFKSFSEVESCLGKNVIIDESLHAIVEAVYRDSKDNVKVLFLSNDKEYNFYLTTAFNRVTIDGHRFGQEIEFEG